MLVTCLIDFAGLGNFRRLQMWRSGTRCKESWDDNAKVASGLQTLHRHHRQRLPQQYKTHKTHTHTFSQTNLDHLCKPFFRGFSWFFINAILSNMHSMHWSFRHIMRTAWDTWKRNLNGGMKCGNLVVSKGRYFTARPQGSTPGFAQCLAAGDGKNGKTPLGLVFCNDPCR